MKSQHIHTGSHRTVDADFPPQHSAEENVSSRPPSPSKYGDLPPLRSPGDAGAESRIRGLPVLSHKHQTSVDVESLHEEAARHGNFSRTFDTSVGTTAFRSNAEIQKSTDKVALLQSLKRRPAIFPSLPNTLFTFDLDCCKHAQDTDGEMSLDARVAKEIARILGAEEFNQGILLTSDGENSHDVKVAKKLVSLCVSQLAQDSPAIATDEAKNKKLARAVERIKLALPAQATIVDFKYDPDDGKITHFDNSEYAKIRKNSGGETLESADTFHAGRFAPQIVIFNNELKKHDGADAYLAVADMIAGTHGAEKERDKATSLIQDLREASESLALAIHPEKITHRLQSDPVFQHAYQEFIADLVKLGNGVVTIEQRDGLQRQNSNDFANRDANEKEWESKASYSSALDKLTSVKNPGVAIVNCPFSQVEEALLQAMRATPEKPIFWTINGNNHFPTHKGLQPILKRIATERALLNRKEGLKVKDIVLIAGNAPGKSPYNAGPLGKFTSPLSGKLHGSLTEAQAIREYLQEDQDIATGYEFILEQNSQTTMENLEYTLKELRERGLDYAGVLCANSQSGFSGLRSALTPFGWQAEGNMPESLFFINPDLSPIEATEGASFKATGKTVIQTLREFKNLTACFAKKIFIPSVPLPEKMVENYKICLQKIGIDPAAKSGSEIEVWLDKMNQIAMTANYQKLIGPERSYGAAAKASAQADRSQRMQENLVQNWMQRRSLKNNPS